jgi:hypothetical protein
MKKITTLLVAILAVFAGIGNLSAQVNGTPKRPVISTAEKPVYFFVESAADGSVTMGTGTANYLGHLLYVPDTTSGVNLKHDTKEVITSTLSIDNALWQLVIEDNLVKFKNKGTGLYMKDCRFATRSTTFNFAATAFDDMPNQYRIRTTDQTSFSVAWYSAANGYYIDRWSASVSNSQIAWYFIVDDATSANYDEMYFEAIKRDLADNITKARAAITNSSVGEEPGQFTQNAVSELEEFIEVAQTIYDSENSIESFQMTIDELQKAVKAYLGTALLPVISDETTTRWYFLQGTRPANTYMSFTGAGLNVVSKAVVPDSTQMWKFVANTSGTGNGFAMVNKATGQYLNADAIYNTAVTAIEGMPVNNLKFVVSDIYTDKRARLWIEHAEGSTPAFRLHAGNASVMNWNGNAYDNSSWLILDYSSALKKFLLETVTRATALLEQTVEGSDFGKYTAESRSTLSSAIATAQAVVDGGASDEGLTSAKVVLEEAMAAYRATIIKNPELLLSSSADNYRWYWIRSSSTHAYASGRVMSLGARLSGEKYTFEPKAAEVSDAQLFRFELTADKLKVQNIVNKLNGQYVSVNGAVMDTAYYAITDTTQVVKEFELIPLTDGISFNIKPAGVNALHAQQSGSHMVNWAGGAGSASAWVIEFALETPKVTSTTSIESDIRIYVTNRTIAVEGVSAYEIYSITGQRMQKNASLNSGVYIVRTPELTVKVLVQ